MKKILLLCIFVCFINIQCSVSAKNGSVCLMNAVTGEVIFEQNMHEKLPPASTTKIMTAIIALENSKLYDVVEMTHNAVRSEGSSTYAKSGDKLYMEDVLYGLMLNSGNDAAYAIAQTVSGTQEDFAKLMNTKAKEIGAKNTCFLNPSGLPQEGHYTTAYDLALIAKYAMRYNKFFEIVSSKTHKVWPINRPENILEFSNHNKLLDMYEGCIGIKTGFTKKAGRCLVSACERDGMKYIAVTLNDPDDWNNHIKMYDYAYENSYPLKVVSKGDVIRVCEDGAFVAEKDFIIPSFKNKKTTADIQVNVSENIIKPVNKYEKVGYLDIICNGEAVGQVNVVSDSDIYGEGNVGLKKSFLSNLKNLFIRFIF